MRMWMTPPELMCRQHLLGEHCECHMILGSLKRGHDLEGYYRLGLIDVAALPERHDALAAEMVRRGYRHLSGFDMEAYGLAVQAVPRERRHTSIDVGRNLEELAERCPRCRASIQPESE